MTMNEPKTAVQEEIEDRRFRIQELEDEIEELEQEEEDDEDEYEA